MSKAADTAAIAASVKKVAADKAAMGLVESVAVGVLLDMHGDKTPVVRSGRGSREARDLVATNLGKKRHRRGWCSL